jgi:3-dehydroquinate dehydratase/shikimate dehydrogenase
VSDAAPATRLVGIVAERTADLARAEAEKAAPLCDMLELRIDHLRESVDLAALVKAMPRPVVATVRRPEEGGKWKGEEAARLALLAAAGRAGAAYLDVEVGVEAPADRGAAALIRSLHLSGPADDSLGESLARLEAEPGEILKLVVPAKDAPNALALLRLLRDRPPSPAARPLAALASGEAGRVSRILQPIFGGALVFAASRRCREVLPGLNSLRDLDREFQIRRLGRSTAFFALLGRPLTHSVSPAIMNAAFRAAGKDAVYVPVPCDDAERTARALVELGVAGLAFTAPHKAVPIWMASLTEAVAAHAVAANTLFRQGGMLVAANTDGPAIRRLSRDALGPLEGKVALVLGTGGTARAAAAALSEERCRVHLLGRNSDKTAAAAATTGAKPGLPGEPEVDLLLNATPVGQWPSDPRDPAAALCPSTKAKVRFDAVYNPRSTAFLEAATGKRIRGLDMLVAQAGDQIRLFGVAKPDLELMAVTGDAALERLERRVVLLGMRGAGKTAVGEALAAATGRPFLDTDRMVENRAGKGVAEIFARYGEEAFRLMERDAVRQALRPTGGVVALGGGGARHLFPSTSPATHVWLRAKRGTLVERVRGTGRPPLLGLPVEEEVDALLAEREPVFEELADLTVDTDGREPGEVAAEIAEALDL